MSPAEKIKRADIAKNAHAIAKTLATGSYRERLSAGFKQAWMNSKAPLAKRTYTIAESVRKYPGTSIMKGNTAQHILSWDSNTGSIVDADWCAYSEFESKSSSYSYYDIKVDLVQGEVYKIWQNGSMTYNVYDGRSIHEMKWNDVKSLLKDVSRASKIERLLAA
ncbi:hypothetical protein [Hymenobacter sublimis]|uniref:Uncharacterized protein n=1 Tax=Hymenobacter sublimis TaxID=2933777 RepID=A0ABY4JCJ6_9BACT|nr:hypothetical protein [Hymenobacter sublimis]UPL50518.1 hypothetical protein MWH26_06325 [Hymenobacter sublimis]